MSRRARRSVRAARTRLLAASSKATIASRPGRLPSTSARSTPGLRRESRTRTRHRSRNFAVPARLPTLFRPAAPRSTGLDESAFRALFTPARNSPRAARRLLPSTTIRKHESSDFDYPARTAHFALRRNRLIDIRCAPRARLRVSRSAFEDPQPRVHGSGALSQRALSGPSQAPLDAMARAGSFTPTRFGSDTSCHPRALLHSRSRRASTSNGPFERENEFRRSPRAPAFAFARVRAASRASSRKEARSAAPEVPFLARPPFRGLRLSTGSSEPVDKTPAPFRSPHLPQHGRC